MSRNESWSGLKWSMVSGDWGIGHGGCNVCELSYKKVVAWFLEKTC